MCAVQVEFVSFGAEQSTSATTFKYYTENHTSAAVSSFGSTRGRPRCFLLSSLVASDDAALFLDFDADADRASESPLPSAVFKVIGTVDFSSIGLKLCDAVGAIVFDMTVMLVSKIDLDIRFSHVYEELQISKRAT